MNYREVKCSDRLPDYDTEEGIYPPIHSVVVPALWEINTEGFHIISSFYDYTNEYWHINLIEYDPPKKGPVYWLEPYELPTEEEMIKVIRAWDDYYLAYNNEYPAMEAHKALAKAITKLIKGER